MRIAYLINQYPAISHSFIRREIAALERRGVRVERYAIRSSSSPLIGEEDIAEDKLTQHIVTTPKIMLAKAIVVSFLSNFFAAISGLFLALRTGVRSEAGLVRHILYYLEALVLISWIRRDKITHIHAHFGTNAAAIAMICAHICKIGFSFTVHGPEEFEKISLISLPEKIKRSKFVVAISSYGASQLKMMTEPDLWNKIKIVHCGLEAEFFKNDGGIHGRVKKSDINQSENVQEKTDFLCVGRYCAQKAQVDLVAAAAKLKAENTAFTMTLIGDGDMRPQIEQAIASHRMEDSVILAGWKSQSEVREALLKSKIFILPSYAEGLPVSIMEAFALGRPVISTFIAGIPELITVGAPEQGEGCGWLVPAGDVEAISIAMKEALAMSPEKLHQMGETGFRRTLERHHIDIEAEKLAAHFMNCHDECAV